jgi:hypothetical protein
LNPSDAPTDVCPKAVQSEFRPRFGGLAQVLYNIVGGCVKACREAKPFCVIFSLRREHLSQAEWGTRGVNQRQCANGAAECCRESEGVLQILSFFYPPKNGGQRGLVSNVETLAAGFASLYPPYIWIPHAQLPRIPLSQRGTRGPARITGKLCFGRATHRGVQRGRAPLRYLLSPQVSPPKTGG